MIACTSSLKTTIADLSRRFMKDRAGNIALSFAIVSVPLLAAMGAGVDYVRAMNHHRELQTNLDAALVAAVKEVGTKDDTQIKTLIANWMAADADTKGAYTLDAKNISIDSSSQVITATVRATVDTTFMRIIGQETIPVAVQASVMGGDTVTKSAFSMFLVLDQSTSMDDQAEKGKPGTKMAALKTAVASLLTTFDTADPNKKYVRTAAVSYSHEMKTPTIMEWGTKKVSDYVKNLQPNGLTDSSDAMAHAYSILGPKEGANSEDAKHKTMNGAVPVKYIVFMTDGENTKYEYNPNTKKNELADNIQADDETKATCASAKAAGIKIYSIAFKAPDRGRALLNTCSSGDGYYYDVQNSSQIVDAFKKIGEQSAKNLVRLTN
jgi:Flp pilus assembly protein TadG